MDRKCATEEVDVEKLVSPSAPCKPQRPMCASAQQQQPRLRTNGEIRELPAMAEYFLGDISATKKN